MYELIQYSKNQSAPLCESKSICISSNFYGMQKQTAMVRMRYGYSTALPINVFVDVVSDY